VIQRPTIRNSSFAILLAISILLAGCRPSTVPTFVPPPTANPVSGSTYTVDYGHIVETIEVRGRVVAKQEASLMFPVAGVLKDVHVLPGDQVEEGTLLAELDAPEIKKEAWQAQFDLQMALTQLEIAELQLEMSEISEAASDVPLARMALERAEVELRYAQVEYDKAIHRYWEPPEVTEAYSWTLRLNEWNHRAAQVKLNLALQSEQLESRTRTIREIQVEQAKMGIERARMLNVWASERLSNTLLTAPFSGIVISLEKGPGDQVRAYEPFGALANPSELWIIATVLEGDAGLLAREKPVTVRLDAHPEEEYSATVLQIPDQPIVWQSQNAYEVIITFDEGQEIPATIRMGASISIAGQSRENVLVVPTRAIITIGEQSYVEVIGGDGEIERVMVQTGLSNDLETEIVAGLQAGQVVRIP